MELILATLFLELIVEVSPNPPPIPAAGAVFPSALAMEAAKFLTGYSFSLVYWFIDCALLFDRFIRIGNMSASLHCSISVTLELA